MIMMGFLRVSQCCFVKADPRRGGSCRLIGFRKHLRLEEVMRQIWLQHAE